MDFSSLSADTAHRFRPVSEILRTLAPELPDSPRLLDVGGFPGTFAREFVTLCPRWKATTLDTPKENLPNYISATGTRMPVEDESFDVVVSIDTYEHIPPQERSAFLAELSRVSRSHVVLAAPFHHNTTAGVERLLNQAHLSVFRKPHPWLGEHVTNGLPSLERTMHAWPKPFEVVDVRRSYDLGAWLTWQVYHMMHSLNGELDNAWEAYDSALAAGPTPVVTDIPYRYIVIAQRDGRKTDVPETFIPPPEAGLEIIEMTRFCTRMLSSFAQHIEKESTNSTALAIDQRLKESLVAAEKEIARLRDQVTAGRGPMTSSALVNIKKLFGG